MSRHIPSILALASLFVVASSLPARAAGSVEVNWLHPEQYADAGRSVVDRDRALQALGEYMGRLGQRLPDGQTLKLDVLDLDLAGEIEPYGRHGWNEVRILRGGADWPRMKIRYTLSADGRTLQSGQANLADMRYSMSTREEELGYEKHMIDKWFKATFIKP